MKKLISVFLLLFLTASLCAFTFAPGKELKAMLPDTPIFAAASFDSEILCYVPQNAILETESETPVEESGYVWYRVTYGDKTGYAEKGYLYTAPVTSDYNIALLKANAPSLGEKIKLYAINDTNATVVAEITDGTKLQHVLTDIDYGDFYEISFNEERVFIEKDRATTGLTLYQKVAVICSSGFAGFLILVFLTIYIYRKKKAA